MKTKDQYITRLSISKDMKVKCFLSGILLRYSLRMKHLNDILHKIRVTTCLGNRYEAPSDLFVNKCSQPFKDCISTEGSLRKTILHVNADIC